MDFTDEIEWSDLGGIVTVHWPDEDLKIRFKPSQCADAVRYDHNNFGWRGTPFVVADLRHLGYEGMIKHVNDWLEDA